LLLCKSKTQRLRLLKEWKVLTPFHIRVRYRHPDSSNPLVGSPALFSKIKFDITLYKVDGESYLVDFKNVLPIQTSMFPLPYGSREGNGGDNKSNPLAQTQSVGLYAFFEATTKLVSHLAMS
jgi:hypothetical protein